MAAMRVQFDVKNKDLKQAQTKKSMEDSKAIQQDKSVKVKKKRWENEKTNFI